jgi:omega-3 fatty acid desaturase (delta-15 desaturase)
MFIDLAILSTAFFTYEYVKNQGLLLHLLYWNVYGFFGWCLFVIGHDCGHGSFSKFPIINSICGNICHSVILVPFHPWARSHYFHHRFHNNKEKDKSHPWVTEEEFKEEFPLPIQYILPSFLGPFIAFWVYLTIGIDTDGSHFIWFGKLYENTSNAEKLKSFISSLSVITWIYVVYSYTESFYTWWAMYGGIVAFCYFWLYMVTWLQHHNEDTLVYSNESWSYLKGAFQTLDHKIGYNIDELHHHISDCHLVHHMFFRGGCMPPCF